MTHYPPAILYGPRGSGKLANASRVADFYGLSSVIASWSGDTKPAPGALYVTSMSRSQIDDARRRVGGFPAGTRIVKIGYWLGARQTTDPGEVVRDLSPSPDPPETTPDQEALAVAREIKRALHSPSSQTPELLRQLAPSYETGSYGGRREDPFCASMQFRLSTGRRVRVVVEELRDA